MRDKIERIGIDEDERLYVKPSTQLFPLVYRESMEIHWNSERGYLYGAVPRKWSYIDWFNHILWAALEQGCELVVTSGTSWVNVPLELQQEIERNRGASIT